MSDHLDVDGVVVQRMRVVGQQMEDAAVQAMDKALLVGDGALLSGASAVNHVPYISAEPITLAAVQEAAAQLYAVCPELPRLGKLRRMMKPLAAIGTNFPAALKAFAKQTIIDEQLRSDPTMREIAVANGMSIDDAIKMLRADLAEDERRAAMPQRKATSRERRKLRHEMQKRLKEHHPLFRVSNRACVQVAFNEIRKATK